MKYSSVVFCLILSMFSLVFLSCDNDNEKKDEIGILTSKAWKRGMIDKNPSTNPSYMESKTIYYAVLNCEQDDSFIFSSDGSLVINHGSFLCEEDKNTEEKGTFSYDKTSNKLTINGLEYNVLEITDVQVKYSLNIPSATGYSYLTYMLQ